jgi:hypothetical protein
VQGLPVAPVRFGARIAPMIEMEGYLLAATHARDAAYDVLLLAHVLAAAVGLGALVIAGANAGALRRSGPDTEALRRYYRPGVNWAGRILFLVPVLGFVLMAMSHGDWSFSDAWITIGLALWALVAVGAEMYLWPAERRLQVSVAAIPSPVPIDGRVPTDRVSERTVEPAAVDPGTAPPETGNGSGVDLRSECLRVVGLAGLFSVALIVAAVVMVAKP